MDAILNVTLERPPRRLFERWAKPDRKTVESGEVGCVLTMMSIRLAAKYAGR